MHTPSHGTLGDQLLADFAATPVAQALAAGRLSRQYLFWHGLKRGVVTVDDLPPPHSPPLPASDPHYLS